LQNRRERSSFATPAIPNAARRRLCYVWRRQDLNASRPQDEAPRYRRPPRATAPAFPRAGSEAVTDYELLELVLFRALPRRVLKPLAKQLLATFGSFAEALSAPRERLAEIKGLGEGAITDLKIVHAAANRLLRGQVKKRPVLSSWSHVLDYCRTAMAA
jgi:DNA repair protein RadC